jgi:hypothetical protein
LRREEQAADPQILHFVAVFEYMTGIRPRPDQLEKLIFALQKIRDGDISGGSALIQQLMSSGKTKILTPFICYVISRSKDLFLIIVSHYSQISAVELELGFILPNNIGRKCDVLSLPFADIGNAGQLAIVSDRVEIALLNRDRVLITESRTLLTLRMKSRQPSSKANHSGNDRKCYGILAQILSTLKENGVSLMDEMHKTLDPKKASIIQSRESSESIKDEHADFLGNGKFADIVKNDTQNEQTAGQITQLIEKDCK